MIFHQFAVFDARSCVFLVGHIVEIGLHHPGDAVVGHQQIGLVGVGLQLVQQVIDALGQLHHALAAVVAVGEVGLGNAELAAVAGRALVFAKALLPQARLTPGGQAGGLGNGHGGVGGAGQGRVQDLIDVHPAGFDGFAQLPGLLAAPLGEGAVGHAADLVFNVPDGLSVAGEIKRMHGWLLTGRIPPRSRGCGCRKSRWQGWASRTSWPAGAPHRQTPPPRWGALPAHPAACWACPRG